MASDEKKRVYVFDDRPQQVLFKRLYGGLQEEAAKKAAEARAEEVRQQAAAEKIPMRAKAS